MSSRRSCAVLVAALALAGCSRRTASFVEPSTGMRFRRIEAGEFVMGSDPAEPGHTADEPAHRVRLTHPFFIAEREMTQREWLAVMGSNPSHFRDSGPDEPVENVSWIETQQLLGRLNREGHGHYRLPTEAEWEYACRAGTTTAYAFGDFLSTSDANYDGRYPLPGQPQGVYRGRPVRTASFRPNRWGLYDMHGNVWEWCTDEHCPYPTAAVTTDPVGRCGSGLKVIRGGSWYFNADSARSALRYTHHPAERGFSLGIRLVRDVD